MLETIGPVKRSFPEERNGELKRRYGASVDAWGCRISSHVSLGRTESGETGVSTAGCLGLARVQAARRGERGEGSRSAKRRKGKAWSGVRGSAGRVVERGGGAMAREPPPRRNDAALLSKIASQEKLRAKLPASPTPPATPPCTPVPVDSFCGNRYDGSRNPEGFTLKYCRK